MVAIKVSGGKVVLESPFHPSLPVRARALGGRWDPASRVWTFDPRDEARVRELARTVYGTDGSAANEPTVTVRLNLDRCHGYQQAIWACGREVAYRPGRDAPVRLGEGVVLIAGGFPARGGSAKYPEVAPREGTVLEVRDVPLAAAQAEVAAGRATIVDGAAERRAALQAERERLAARLAEIDAELASC